MDKIIANKKSPHKMNFIYYNRLFLPTTIAILRLSHPKVNVNLKKHTSTKVFSGFRFSVKSVSILIGNCVEHCLFFMGNLLFNMVLFLKPLLRNYFLEGGLSGASSPTPPTPSENRKDYAKEGHRRPESDRQAESSRNMQDCRIDLHRNAYIIPKRAVIGSITESE